MILQDLEKDYINFNHTATLGIPPSRRFPVDRRVYILKHFHLYCFSLFKSLDSQNISVSKGEVSLPVREDP